MKKILTSVLVGLCALGASATEYVVYGPTLSEGQVQIPSDFYIWGNCSSEDLGDARQFTANSVAAGWWGAGFLSTTDFDLEQLRMKNCVLKFDYKTTSNGTFKLQFKNDSKGNAVEPVIQLPARDGEWHSMEIDVRKTFGDVLDTFHTGDRGYLFCPVGANDWADETIDFRNVRFDVSGDAVSDPVYELGGKWYGHVEVSTKNNNMADYVDLAFDYVLTANMDGTLTVEAQVDGDYKSLPNFGGFQINIYGDADEWGPKIMPDENGMFGRTTTSTFDLEKAMTPFFWIPYFEKAERVDISGYKFGASNEAPTTDPKLRLSASVGEVGFDSAEVKYNVKASNHFDNTPVKVLLNETEITENPYTITGLNELTDYSYTLTAVAELDGVKYTSDPVTLTFKTKSSTAKAKTWYAIADGMVKRAWIDGQSSDDRHDTPISIETEVTYNTDGTITVVATPHCEGNIVGLVPKLTCSSSEFKTEYQPMAVADGKWSFTTTTVYPEEHNIGWLYFNLAHTGTESNINVNGYATGKENEKPGYGEVASLEILLANNKLATGESTNVLVVAKDNNGHYLFDVNPEIWVDGDNFELNNGVLTASAKGNSKICAKVGNVQVENEVKCFLSREASRIEHVALESNHANPALAFDDNEGTQVEWNCAETQEHYIKIDLGKVHAVEAVRLVWEGASATHYTVTLETPKAAENAPKRLVAQDGHVFTVENGEGGAGVTARTDLHLDDYTPIAAQYVTLNTTKAYNAGWGIKLKEMQVMGVYDENIETGVDAVVNLNEAPVEVYNLQGVKVADDMRNLPAGIYVVRQGAVSYKTVVK